MFEVVLNSELDESKSKTQFLEARKRKLESELSVAQENNQTLSNTIEYLMDFNYNEI